MPSTLLPSGKGEAAALRTDDVSAARRLWFPFEKAAHFSNPPLAVLCIHGSGMEQQVWTGQGTPRQPQENPLLQFCLQNNTLLLAAQLPGRALRTKEKPCASAAEAAEAVLRHAAPILFGEALNTNVVSNSQSQSSSCKGGGVPYVICAHSAGCLVAYEICCLARRLGRRLPLHLFLSSMVAPTTPEDDKPWRLSALLSEAELQEEAKQWDANPVVFRPDMWEAFSPMLRADFKLFDEYRLPDEKPKLDIPTTLVCAKNDKRVSRESMEGWGPLLHSDTGKVKRLDVEGNHNFFYVPEQRAAYFHLISEQLDSILLDLTY